MAFDTAAGWLATLDRLYFLFELRPFAGKLPRTLRREAKVYLFDHTEPYLRVSDHREHLDRRIVNTRIGIVNTKIGHREHVDRGS